MLKMNIGGSNSYESGLMEQILVLEISMEDSLLWAKINTILFLEALACQDGIKLWNEAFQHFIVETDCQPLLSDGVNRRDTGNTRRQ